MQRVRYSEIEGPTEEQSLADEETAAEPLLAELVSESSEPAHLVASHSASPPRLADGSLNRREFIQKAELNGFTVLRDDFEDPMSMILRGEPAAWNDAPFAPPSISRLSLEDIFIALAGEATPRL